MKNLRQGGALVAALAMFVSTSAAARAQDDEAIETCHNLGSTADIVQCLDKANAQWDKRLNAAYQKALKSVDPAGAANG